MGEPQHRHSLDARGTTALHPSQSLGSELATLPGALAATLSLFAIVEMVLTDVRHHPETQMVAGIIEDETVGLAFGSAQAATDSLDEESSAPCRPSMDDATDHRQVDAGREDADVANDLRRPGAEPIEDALTVRPIGKGVHVLGRDAGLDKALRDMLRMPTIHAIDERRPSLAEPEPGLDNIAGDDRPIHRVGKLALMKIARHGADVR